MGGDIGMGGVGDNEHGRRLFDRCVLYGKEEWNAWVSRGEALVEGGD
jgi:hypothetical protein